MPTGTKDNETPAARGIAHRLFTKADGRALHLFGDRPAALDALAELEPVAPPRPHRRWHPLRQEWVIYATNRQTRTFKPPASYCPLCAGRSGGVPTEIPFADFDVAVFDNRFPGFHMDAPPPPPLPPGLGIEASEAVGKCELVVYSPDHEGSLATLGAANVRLIVEAWVHRYRALLADPRIDFVLPFENRGEEVGVTLHHPHGQIYGFGFVPPIIRTMAEAQIDHSLADLVLGGAAAPYGFAGNQHVSVVVPPVARFPFETWVVPKRRVPGPWAMNEGELTGLADALCQTVARLDGLFGRPMPYIMVLYAAPTGYEDSFHFHIQFLPFLRDQGKLKYLAGCEQGAGSFLVDMTPEEMAERLRDVAVAEA